MDSSWDASKLTWNSNNPIVGSIVDQNVSHNGCSYYNFNVTQSINSWYNRVNGNCGWRIAYSNESEKDLTRLYSSDCGVSSSIPNLTINYKSSNPTVSGRPINDGIYYLRNVNSRKCMDTYNSNTANGTSIIQYSFNGNKNQQWKVKYESDGYYSLRPVHISGQTKTIDMRNSTLANTNGTDAQIFEYSSGYQEQKFLIQSAVGGGYQIGTKQSGGNKVLEVTNSSTNNGEVIQIWEYSTARTNDNWDFIPLSKERYCFTATNFTGVAPYYNAPMSNAITPIQDNFNRMGYDVEYYQPLNAGKGQEFINSLKDYKINVIHGHGYAGGVVFLIKKIIARRILPLE